MDAVRARSARAGGVETSGAREGGAGIGGGQGGSARRICRPSRLLFLLLVVAAAWYLGQGLWIYAKAEAAQHLLHRAWERTQVESRPVRPWPWADTWPVAKLTVPRLGIDHIVLANASGRTLAFGPALYGPAPLGDGNHVTEDVADSQADNVARGAAKPIVLTGHRDTHFSFLEALQSGDLLTFEWASGGRRRYRVTSMRIVDSRDGLALQSPDVGQVVLVTCYPFHAITPGGPLRYVVTADEVADGEGAV